MIQFSLTVAQAEASNGEKIVQWLIGIVGIALAFAILYALGITGQLVRRGVRTRSALASARSKLTAQGNSINELKYARLMRKANAQILLPVLGWILAYVAGFWWLATNDADPSLYLWGLLPLLLPIMGFFGWVITPAFDDDPLN